MVDILHQQKVYIGMGGWELASFNKLFYPPKPKKGFRKLEFYSQFFDCIEVNATFYNSLFAPEYARRWLDDVAANKEFVFTVKLYHGFTHTFDATAEDVRGVHRLLEPLAAVGKLGGLLIQFPYLFTNLPERRRYLMQLSKVFAHYRLFVEVRHNSWNSPLMYNFFQENKLHLVNVDLPPIKRHMPLTALVRNGAAYFRLMGRNSEVWNRSWRTRPDELDIKPEAYCAKGASAFGGEPLDQMHSRYHYLYNEGELQHLVNLIEYVKAQARTIFVIFHNDPEANSLVNGFQLRHFIKNKQRVLVPENLVREFPLLGKISYAVNLSHPLFSEMQ